VRNGRDDFIDAIMIEVQLIDEVLLNVICIVFEIVPDVLRGERDLPASSNRGRR
jgi:hypothetical protein